MRDRIRCLLVTGNGITRLAFYDAETGDTISCFSVSGSVSLAPAPVSRTWSLEEIEGELVDAREREK